MDNKLLLLQSAFMESFGNYIGCGYNQLSIDAKLDNDGKLDSIIIQLINKPIDRTLFFRFQTYNGPKREIVSEFVWFSIDSNEENDLSLERYWRQKKGEKNCIVSLADQVAGDTLKERATNYFKIVKATLDNDLKQVLEGTAWIDTPFDWYGYDR
jgi:hypothetical protein